MEPNLDYWPLLVLAIGTISVILLIVVFRVHAFLALMISSMLVGVLSRDLPGEDTFNSLVQAVELTMTAFGTVAGQIAFVIAMASILGVALTESRAAESIVIKMIEKFGESKAAVALLISGFILSIPVFFDTVFFLLIPIARSMGIKTGKNYLLYVMAISSGAVITHSVVPPTPGPLIMAETLHINIGVAILIGSLMGILPAACSYFFAKKLSARFDIKAKPWGQKDQRKDEATPLPTFINAILPIILPVTLIVMGSMIELMFQGAIDSYNSTAKSFLMSMGFLGNKNVAMFLGTLLSLWVLARQKRWGMKKIGEMMGKPLEIAGVIILITAAGGSFGTMISHSGIGEIIEGLGSRGLEINLIILAWLISSALKFAQGSGTVAMIITSGIMFPMIESAGKIEFHPVYIFAAIGFGSLTISWMNDSAFWVVGKLSGFTEKETLKTWTALLASLSLVGLLQTLLLSYLFPLV